MLSVFQTTCILWLAQTMFIFIASDPIFNNYVVLFLFFVHVKVMHLFVWHLASLTNFYQFDCTLDLWRKQQRIWEAISPLRILLWCMVSHLTDDWLSLGCLQNFSIGRWLITSCKGTQGTDCFCCRLLSCNVNESSPLTQNTVACFDKRRKLWCDSQINMLYLNSDGFGTILDIFHPV